MLKAFAELGEGDDGNELARRYADELRPQHHDHVNQNVIQQVVAVVALHRHRALCVVQRRQPPPPLQLMPATGRR